MLLCRFCYVFSSYILLVLDVHQINYCIHNLQMFTAQQTH